MLQKIGFNVIITLVIGGICFYFFHQSGILEEAGMAAIFLNWLPILVAFATLLIYFIFRLISKKWSWIITLLGALTNIWLVISAYMQVGNELI